MIELHKDPLGIATITLNRPEKHNAFDDHVIKQMTQAFREVESDDSIRVLVLAAQGKNFCAGADLQWMKRMATYSYEENLNDARELAEMLKTLNFLTKPTIARVQGAAFGGAVGLVSCCDIVVAADTASFCLSEVKVGLIPATISPYVIAAMGERAARRYFISAERFSAQTALETGMVSEVCAHDELDQRVSKLCQQILLNSPAATQASKKLVSTVSKQAISDELIETTSQAIAEIRTSAEGQEGLSAFIEKRSPAWFIDIKERD